MHSDVAPRAVARATGDERFGLPARFWRAFRRRCWESEGTVLRSPFGLPIATPLEVLRCLVRAGEAYRPHDADEGVEFCLEGAALLADVGKYLPRASDRTPAAYARRVTRLLAGRRFGLVVSDLQQHGAPLWFRLREFVRGLAAEVGAPATAKATLFMGNYRNTPFGVHRGQSSNFMFVVAGRKRILGWPDAYMRCRRAAPTYTLDYRRFRQDAVVLEGGPGDVIYFPSDYWHIGEDVGGVSMALSLMLFMESPPAEHLLPHVRDRLADCLDAAPRANASARRGAARVRTSTIASQVDAALGGLRTLSADPALRQALTARCLNRATGSGFAVVPPARRLRSLPASAVVRGDPRYPVRWLAVGKDELVCSANGHAFTVAARRRIPELLGRLNSGEPARVRDLVRDYSTRPRDRDRLPPAEVRALLDKLVSLRAVTTTSRA